MKEEYKKRKERSRKRSINPKEELYRGREKIPNEKRMEK